MDILVSETFRSPVHRSASNHCSYHEAIRVLQQNEILITFRRLSLLVGVKDKSAAEWVRRNRKLKRIDRSCVILNQIAVHRKYLITWLEWHYRIHPRSRITKTELAVRCGYERCSFLRILRRDAEVREIIKNKGRS